MAMTNAKKVKILFGIALAIIVFIFSIVFFQFPDNTLANFVFRVEEDGYATLMGYTGNAKHLEVPDRYEGHEVRYVSDYAFGGHYSLLESIVLPDSIVSIDEYAFANSPVLKKVKLPAKLETIGRGAFSLCPQLKDIELPGSLKVIDDEAFYGCIRLKRLYVPAGVEVIGNDAFAACESLLLDVQDNPLAAEVAETYRIETGRFARTNVYFGIILTVTLLLLTLLIVLFYVWKRKRRGKKVLEENPR